MSQALDPTLATAPAGAQEDPGQDAWAVAWRQLRRKRLAMGALWAIFLLFGVACFAPLLASGRPLYLRAHVTSVYENDVAAFLDWDQRLRETSVLLASELPVAEREAVQARRELYIDGLPEILERIGAALDAPQRARFVPLKADYVNLLRAGAPAADLAAAAAAIDHHVGALSLGAAYKKAAAPLLAADGWVEAVSDARAAGEDLSALAAKGRALAGQVDAGVALMTAFLPQEERAAPDAATARGARALRTAADPDWTPAGAREALRGLEAALDHAAGVRVPQALQQLPQVTQWPAFRYLTPAEVGFMALFVTCALAIALRGSFLALSGRGRAAALLAPGVAAAALWAWLVPAGLAPADSLYKELARTLAAQRAADPAADGSVVFPLVPFGENENIYADRVTPPVMLEVVSAAYEDGLKRRMREPTEPPIDAAEARLRLNRLRSHWLGTDDNGRDILARLIIGSRVSLSVGFVAVSIYVAIGIVLGALAGYFRGWVDIVISRVNEIVTCFPAFFLIISIMSIVTRPSIFHVMVVIGLTRWTEVFRLVRAEFLRLGSLDFVTAGRALGLTDARIVFRHVLPNALGPVFVAAAFGVAGAILVESALSFLGFGVPPPQASWGSVLHDARGHEQQMWWITIFPGLLIFITITAYNLLGEGLRDALDPRLRR